MRYEGGKEDQQVRISRKAGKYEERIRTWKGGGDNATKSNSFANKESSKDN